MCSQVIAICCDFCKDDLISFDSFIQQQNRSFYSAIGLEYSRRQTDHCPESPILDQHLTQCFVGIGRLEDHTFRHDDTRFTRTTQMLHDIVDKQDF